MCTSCKSSCKCDDAPRKNTPDEIIEVATAIKNGKPLESRHLDYNTAWGSAEGCHFPNFATKQYRVKREPRVMYAGFHSNGNFFGASTTEAMLDRVIAQTATGVITKHKFVEVLDN